MADEITEPVAPVPEPAPEPIPEPVVPLETADQGVTDPVSNGINGEEVPVSVTESVPVIEPPVEAAAPPAAMPAVSSPLRPLNHATAKELSVKAHAATQNLIRKKLERLMALFDKKKLISNDDVQIHLIVSDATAARYLGILVREGRIVKEGKGNATRYRKL